MKYHLRVKCPHCQEINSCKLDKQALFKCSQCQDVFILYPNGKTEKVETERVVEDGVSGVFKKEADQD